MFDTKMSVARGTSPFGYPSDLRSDEQQYLSFKRKGFSIPFSDRFFSPTTLRVNQVLNEPAE